WAVFAGGVLQLAFQVPYLSRMGLLPQWRLNLSHPGVRRILKLMAPAAFGVSISQVSLLINTIFASFLVSGSVSWLYYADRLMEFPAGMLGVALVKILAPGFYARQNIRTPVKIGIVTLVLTQLMNLAFVGPLKHAGLALAIGLGACLNAALLYRGLRAHGVYTPQPGWPVFLLKI